MNRSTILTVFLTLSLFVISCTTPATQTPPTLPTVTETIAPTETLTPTLTPVPTETESAMESLSPFEVVSLMQRGVNMGNTLEAPVEGEWGFVITQQHFDLIQAAGFDAVRLPTRWSAHALETAPYTIEADFFERVDEVVDWALDRELIVVLNIHHYDPRTVTIDSKLERFLAIWRQIAERYQDYPPQLVFEMLNEPDNSISEAQWNAIVARTLTLIRASNPTRNVIIGGINWNSYDQLPNLELPSDGHVIGTFHYYLPFQFTHQGADWVDGSNAWLGTPWKATDAQQAEVNAHFGQVADWSKEHNIPVYLGEFGAYERADQASRVRWTTYVREQAEARGFAWAYWEFGAGFGVYDRSAHQWHEDLLRALIPAW